MLTDLCRTQLNDRGNAFPFCDPATAHVDCNVAVTSEAVELAGHGQLDARTVRRLGLTANGPTGVVLTRRVFVAMGMLRDVDYRILGAVDVQTVRDLLDDGWFVGLHVDCGWLQDHAPELVGDRHYRGAHSVALFDWWRGPKGQSVHLANPLFDGRNRGNWSAPMGVQSAKFSDLRDAAYAYTGVQGVMHGFAIVPASGV